MRHGLILWCALGVVAGCGKIEIVTGADFATGNLGDGGGGGGDMAQNPTNPSIVVAARPVDQPSGGSPKYLPLAGLDVILDATGTTDPKSQTLSYAWKVVTVPSASKVNDAAVTTPTSIMAKFVPDVGGDYTFELTATATDTRSAKKQLTFTVTTAMIYYADIQLADMLSAGITPTQIRSDGSSKRAVGCPHAVGQAFTGDSDPVTITAFGAVFATAVGYRPLDPATGVEPASRIVYALENPVDLGKGLNFIFNVAEEDSDCSTKPPKAVPVPAAGTALRPRWSPDASRFLYMTVGQDADSAQLAVATATEASPVTGLESLYVAHVPPAWADDTSIVFAVRTQTAPDQYKLYKAKLTGAVASDVGVYADCATASMNWFGAEAIEVRNNVVYLSLGDDNDFRTHNIYKIVPDGSLSCTPINLTATTMGQGAHDFSVSPDGKWVVYSRVEQATQLDMDVGGIPGLDIYIVDTSAPGTGKKLAGDPNTIDYGPTFIAGGRQVVFYAGPEQSIFGRNDLGARTLAWKGLTVVNLDGSNPRALVAGSAVTDGTDGPPVSFSGSLIGGNFIFGNCKIDPLATPLSAAASALLLAAAIYLGVRRRRRD